MATVPKKTTVSRSRLSYRLSICDLINQLDEHSCLGAIRSIHHELGYQNLNALLVKLVMNVTDNTTPDSFVKMANTKQDDSKLLRLPVELNRRISLFLNDKDIFRFEQCCRLFYQIVNSLSFIKQSNAFKTFKLTPKRLRQMTQAKNNFYKYCKATTLVVESFSQYIHPDTGYIQTQLNNAQNISNYDQWLSTMFRSIKLLNIDQNRAVLLAELPIDTLFDPIESSLEKLKLMRYRERSASFETNVNKFLTNLKITFQNQRKNIKQLKCVEQTSVFSPFTNQLFYVECKHAVFFALGTGLLDTSLCKYNSSLRMITFRSRCSFESIGSNSNSGYSNTDDSNSNGKIETLRLINFDQCSDADVLENQRLIELLNLQNSVKNLTLDIQLDAELDDDDEDEEDGDYQRWDKIISDLLMKKYYFHLTNVNILFQFSTNNDLILFRLFTWVFGILKKHQNILRYQFKQLNIGIRSAKEIGIYTRCHILQWNSKIDEQNAFNPIKQSRISRKREKVQRPHSTVVGLTIHHTNIQ